MATDPLQWFVDFRYGASAYANFVQRGGGVIAFIDTTGLNTFRDSAGRFNSNQRAVRDLYGRMAKNIQNDVVNRTRRGYVRPRVSTGRLERVLADRRNITVDQFGFTVGNEAFMASSAAKYWRQIEFGTRGVVPRWIGRMVDRNGVPLYGLWDFNPTGWGAGPYSRYGAGSGQKLHPYSAQKRAEMVYGDVRDSIGRRLGQRRPRAPFRRKHITPKNAFREAWDAAKITPEGMDRALEIYLKGTAWKRA